MTDSSAHPVYRVIVEADETIEEEARGLPIAKQMKHDLWRQTGVEPRIERVDDEQ